jgi:hypothetical protein
MKETFVLNPQKEFFNHPEKYCTGLYPFCKKDKKGANDR